MASSEQNFYFRGNTDKLTFHDKTKDQNWENTQQENTVNHRLRDIPMSHTIPEHLRGHARFEEEDPGKIVWKGKFQYKITKDGLKLI
eukprot:403338261